VYAFRYAMTGPNRRFPARALLLLAGLVACLRWLLAEVARLKGGLGFPLDDSWIHLQFARNLAHGAGLSYNPGDLVTGSTAPLWTALLAVLFLLPGSVLAWTQLLGVLLYLAGIDATWRLSRELGSSPALAALASALTLATSWLVWSALSGMEIPLFILLSLWGMILHLRERADRRRPPLSLAVLAVGVLARPEGVLLLLLAFLDRLLACEDDPSGTTRWRRPSFRVLLTGAGLAACAVAGSFLFYGWAGGSVVPTTYAAKGGGEVRHLLPDFRYLSNVLGLFFRPQPWATLLAGGGAATLAGRLGTPRDRGLLPALWLFGMPLAYSLLTPGPTKMLGNFGRYYFPLFPVLIVLAVLALEPLLLARLPLSRPLRIALSVLGAAALLAPTVAVLVQGERLYVQSVANVQESDVAVAGWLAAHVPPDAVLAVNDIGAIKYLLPNRIVDLASIATPEIGREVSRAAAAGTPWPDAMMAAVERRHPDYVVIFPSWFPTLARDPRFRAVYTLPIQNNITMGGNEIVVYATPWTR
jgi:4-amino-4-deoxy-L-arabinose transferase-like glycosyltransferase